MNNLLLCGRNLGKAYGSGETLTQALRGVSLDLLPGKVTLVMGPSGCGKSTLLAVLSGLLHPTAGQVFVGSQDLYTLSRARRRDLRLQHFGFIFQGNYLFPTLTVQEQLEMVLRWGEGAGAQEARKRTRELLELLDLRRKAKLLPIQLSGGEQQRVAIGRALIKRPDFFFADEPTSALDWEHGQQVMEILASAAHSQSATCLVVAHDPRVMSYADEILHLDDGVLKEPELQVAGREERVMS